VANTSSIPPAGGSAYRFGRWLTFILLGGFLGLIVAMLTLFELAFLYGEAMGLSGASCVGVACSITLL